MDFEIVEEILAKLQEGYPKYVLKAQIRVEFNLNDKEIETIETYLAESGKIVKSIDTSKGINEYGDPIDPKTTWKITTKGIEFLKKEQRKQERRNLERKSTGFSKKLSRYTFILAVATILLFTANIVSTSAAWYSGAPHIYTVQGTNQCPDLADNENRVFTRFRNEGASPGELSWNIESRNMDIQMSEGSKEGSIVLPPTEPFNIDFNAFIENSSEKKASFKLQYSYPSKIFPPIILGLGKKNFAKSCKYEKNSQGIFVKK
ncbi:hypothetical protein [Candidatus Nanohalovita haloferacivicina]|uniref:hypothetical protein n=1 Tax=Candidatus Nanohalovita haloferacivicina TaxID=2978046 RepID=UPI00325FC364